VLELGDGLAVDAARVAERGHKALPRLERRRHGEAGHGPEALQEGAALHVLQCALWPDWLVETELLGRGVVQQAQQLPIDATRLLDTALKTSRRSTR
jgi:hypothetical protein